MTQPRPVVRLATFEDAEPIADMLADAFLDYEWSRWAVPADNRRERLRGLHLLYAGLLGAEVGGTWVTDDISSVVNWVKPGGARISDALRTRLNEESAAFFGDRLEAVDALDAETLPLRPTGPYWYLATVGTRPDRRGEGLASLVGRRLKSDGTFADGRHRKLHPRPCKAWGEQARYGDETWEEPILAQVAGIELDAATIGAVVAALGGAPRPVALDRARIDRQMRELALEHAAGRLEDAVYLERLRELREAKDDVGRMPGERVAAERAIAPRALSDVGRGRRPRGEGGRAPRNLRPDRGHREDDRVDQADAVGVRARTGAGAAARG